MANINRVNSELQKQISEIILFELKDPRITGMLTVTEVQTSNDLKYAKVFVSYFGEEEHRKDVYTALDSSANYIRNLLKTRIRIRYIPSLKIIEDRSAEYSVHINSIIDKAMKGISDE